MINTTMKPHHHRIPSANSTPTFSPYKNLPAQKPSLPYRQPSVEIVKCVCYSRSTKSILDENGKEALLLVQFFTHPPITQPTTSGGFGMTLTVLDNILTFTIQIPYLIVIAIIIVLVMLYSKRK